MTSQSKSKRSDRFRKMIEGTKQNSGPSIVFEGGSYAAADIEKVLQSSIDAVGATATATAAFHQAIVAERAASAKGDGVYRTLRTVLIAQYTSQPAVLAEYGIELVSKQVPDASKVATAVVKRVATRAARHTMGKRQKKGVKGDVTGVTVTPVTAPKPVVTGPGVATTTPPQAPAPAPGATPRAT